MKGKKTGGRPKGSLNRNNIELKEMIRNALDASGGQKWLQEQMHDNPVAFMGLLGKILPSEVRAEVRQIVDPSDLMDRIKEIAYLTNKRIGGMRVIENEVIYNSD